MIRTTLTTNRVFRAASCHFLLMKFNWGVSMFEQVNWPVGQKKESTMLKAADNKALDAEPPVASFRKSMLIGGGPVNAAVRAREFQQYV